MKILGLLRHAKSDWDDLATRDFDRGLNARGRKGADVIGAHIRDHGIRWDAVLASPAARVRQTLAAAMPRADPVFDERLYLASPETLIEAIADQAGDCERLLVVGHNPGLQELLYALVPEGAENALFKEAAVKLPTAAFLVFELAIEDWADLGPDCGTLVHFARPRDLDPELGPED